MNSALVEYYKLCAIVPKRLTHRSVLNIVKPASIDIIFTKKQILLYMRDCGDKKCIRETVVGAGKNKIVTTKAIVI